MLIHKVPSGTTHIPTVMGATFRRFSGISYVMERDSLTISSGTSLLVRKSYKFRRLAKGKFRVIKNPIDPEQCTGWIRILGLHYSPHFVEVFPTEDSAHTVFTIHLASFRHIIRRKVRYNDCFAARLMGVNRMTVSSIVKDKID